MLFKSGDEGQSWTPLSPDLTRHDPATMGPSGGPITLDQTTAEYYATIFAIAESPVTRGVLWVGSDDGLIHLTQDAGRTWVNVTPPDVKPFARISIIEASPHAAGTAYVASNRYQLGDPAPYIYKTSDFGRTWTKIVEGLPATEPARAVREDPERAGLLFAGTERGVYVSFDDGGHWQSLRRNLSLVPVHDLAIKEGDLIAATHGRSFWILDDIAPLRQLADSALAGDAHLYRPRDAYRVDWGGGSGSDNAAHPVGKNPPSGAMIYYWLKAGGREVTLDVLDSGGHVIRSFTSVQDSMTRADSLRADTTKRVRTDSLRQAGVTDSVKVDSILGDTLKDDDKAWPHRPPALPRIPAKAGLNLFAWNLRLPGVTPFWGMRDIATDGPMVLPGAYRLRLKVGGKEYAQDLHVRADPRGQANIAGLAEQYRFLRQLRDTVNAATTTILTLRNVRAQIEDRMPRLSGGGLSRARDLAGRLRAIEDSLYQGRTQDVEDELVFPARVTERISGLAGVVESADGRPPQQTYDVFAMFAPQLQQQLQAAGAALRDGLPAVNAALQAKRLPAIEPKAVELRPPKPVGN